MKKIAGIFALLMLAVTPAHTEAPAQAEAEKPAPVEAPAYQVVKEKSFLKFFALQNGAPVEGGFGDFTADIRFDPEHPDQSSIAVEVNTASVIAANEDVAKNLKLPEWLSVEAFPKAVFKSKTITRMPMSDNYYSEGELTLHGKTVPVTLNFQMNRFDGKRAIATGYATLRRLDYGIGQGEWAKPDVIKNEVRVQFRIVADRK